MVVAIMIRMKYCIMVALVSLDADTAPRSQERPFGCVDITRVRGLLFAKVVHVLQRGGPSPCSKQDNIEEVPHKELLASTVNVDGTSITLLVHVRIDLTTSLT